jgi:hypothetical protein
MRPAAADWMRRAFQRLGRAGEFGHHAVAGEGKDGSGGKRYGGAQVVQLLADPAMRVVIVVVHQQCIVLDSGGQDGCEPAFGR